MTLAIRECLPDSAEALPLLHSLSEELFRIPGTMTQKSFTEEDIRGALRLAGEHTSLREQALNCFDWRVNYVTESSFEEAYALHDEGLDANGSVDRPLQHWKAHYTKVKDKVI
jgi:hypothetical protein